MLVGWSFFCDRKAFSEKQLGEIGRLEPCSVRSNLGLMFHMQTPRANISKCGQLATWVLKGLVSWYIKWWTQISAQPETSFDGRRNQVTILISPNFGTWRIIVLMGVSAAMTPWVVPPWESVNMSCGVPPSGVTTERHQWLSLPPSSDLTSVKKSQLKKKKPFLSL